MQLSCVLEKGGTKRLKIFQISLFFLEHAGELRIISLIEGEKETDKQT
jgi:hypothetical protein